MFDFLKKKIANFTDKLKQTLQKQPATQEQAGTAPPSEQALPTTQQPAAEQILSEQTQKEQSTTQSTEQPTIEAPQLPATIIEKSEEKKQRKKKQKNTPQISKTPATEQQKPTTQKPESKPSQEEKVDIAGEQKSAIEKATHIREDEKRELKAKQGIFGKIAGIVLGKIKITEQMSEGFFDELELSLLESDVEQKTALAIVEELKKRLVGAEISSREDISKFLKEQVRESLQTIMQTKKIEILATQKKPFTILFLGPNGAGKTTSIAKIANYLKQNGKSSILAAADTFRAASIEQLEAHANAIGIKVIKHQYGSDPAAVAFDAIAAAKAKHIDYVLIDSAGRQETNHNLIEELKKLERVAKPDLKLYVGEAYTGQALLDQASEFNAAIGIDGFILTKIDTDTKGGSAISLLYSLKKPIVFVGTGQRYSDILEFKPEFIIDRIL
ncbi:MAG TPA: signal recognition particle-docking protein FtsY [archaeon]|nr:signal recognition particle-docking protein FtsY [archaeon]